MSDELSGEAAEDQRAANIAARVKSKAVKEKLEDAADTAVQKAVEEVIRGLRIYLYLPNDRTAYTLLDSRQLWDVLWSNRATLQGVAHSHPGFGVPRPSYQDLTTFAGVELGLGRRLALWIASKDSLVTVLWAGPGRYDYVVLPMSLAEQRYCWLPELRRTSHFFEEGERSSSSVHRRHGNFLRTGMKRGYQIHPTGVFSV